MSDLRKPEIACAAVRGTEEQRQRLQEGVAQLATAMAAGEIRMDETELEALARICIDHCLPIEAMRIRRWIPRAGREGGSPGSG